MRYGAAEVFEEISEKIKSGTYPSGSALIEADLATEYSVSRNTIKKVLLMLENKGYVTIEINKGAKVRSFTQKDIEEMMQVREVLEGLVVSLAVPVLTDEAIDAMGEALKKMKGYLETNELLQYSECNHQFHQYIYDACPNKSAVNMLIMLKEQISKFNIKTILISGRGEHSYQEHSMVLEAIRNRNAEEASRWMRYHIMGVEQTMKEYQKFII